MTGDGRFQGGGQIRCEFCETQQPPASTCSQCGLRLKLPPNVLPSADPPIERISDLEPTSSDHVEFIGAGEVPGLELTHFDAAIEVPDAPVPGFETTSDVLLIDLPGDDSFLPDLERTTEDFERSAPPVGMPEECPWCGHVQPEGRMCDHCGRSRMRVLPPKHRIAPTAKDDGPRVRCRMCGITVVAAALCTDCGQPLPPVSDD